MRRKPAVDQLDVLSPAQYTPHGFREKDLAAPGLGGDAGGGVHSFPEQVRLLSDRLACVQADTDLHLLVGVLAVVLLQCPLDADGAGYGLSRRGEGHHEAVAQGLDLVAAVLLDLPSHKVKVGVNNLLGSAVAPTRPQIGGAFHVGEEDSDGAFRELVCHRSHP